MRVARTDAEAPSPRRVEARADAPGALHAGGVDEAFGETFREAVARIDREDAAPERNPRTEREEPIANGAVTGFLGGEAGPKTNGTASLDGWLAFLSGPGDAPQRTGDAEPADEPSAEPSMLDGPNAGQERPTEAHGPVDERDRAGVEEATATTAAGSLPPLALIGLLPSAQLPPACAETVDDEIPSDESGAARRSAAGQPHGAGAGGETEGPRTAPGVLVAAEELRLEAASAAVVGAGGADGRATHDAHAASLARDGAAAMSRDGTAAMARDGAAEASGEANTPRRDRSKGVGPETVEGGRRHARGAFPGDAEPSRGRGAGVGPEAAEGDRRDAREAVPARGGESRVTDAANDGAVRVRLGTTTERSAAGEGAPASNGRDVGPGLLGDGRGVSARLEPSADEDARRVPTEAERGGRERAAPLGGGRVGSGLAGEEGGVTTDARTGRERGRVEPAARGEGAAKAETRSRARHGERTGTGHERPLAHGADFHPEVTGGAVVPAGSGLTETFVPGPTEPSAPPPTATLTETTPARMPEGEPGTPASPSERWNMREGYLPPSAPDARTSIELDHPTLGPLSLRFAGETGRVAVELGASSIAAAVALRSSEAELRRELAGTGTELARFRVRTKGRVTSEDAPTLGTWQPAAGHARRRI